MKKKPYSLSIPAYCTDQERSDKYIVTEKYVTHCLLSIHKEQSVEREWDYGSKLSKKAILKQDSFERLRLAVVSRDSSRVT